MQSEKPRSDTAAKTLKIKSDFALLDVMTGRARLLKKLGYTGQQAGVSIPVTITGYLIGAWGSDDGTSQEFEVKVTGVKLDE